jgi:hypothetical protein
MKILTGCLNEFFLLHCEDITVPGLQGAACNIFRTGYSAGVQSVVERAVACMESGEFDARKFERLMKPLLDDMAVHGRP